MCVMIVLRMKYAIINMEIGKQIQLKISCRVLENKVLFASSSTLSLKLFFPSRSYAIRLNLFRQKIEAIIISQHRYIDSLFSIPQKMQFFSLTSFDMIAWTN